MVSFLCLSCIICENVNDDCVIRFEISLLDFSECLWESECFVWFDVVFLAVVVVVVVDVFIDFRGCNVFKITVMENVQFW